MSGPLMQIGGIASGLPPDIVDQLMEVERAPLQRLVSQQDQLRADQEAWGQVTSKLSGVRSAVDALRRPGSLAGLFKATSSSTEAVEVSVTGEPPSGRATFSVEQLAQAMQRSSADTFAGLDEALDGRTLEIDGVDVTAGLGPDATLADLVDAVNAAGVGVQASTLQVTPGTHRLVLAAEHSGSDGEFTVAAAGWDHEFGVTRSAQDAVLDVGGITVTRSSNQIDDLFDGLTLDLKRTTEQAVTITSERDVDAAVDRVADLVERINETLETISELAAYDPETGSAGPLQGDATARRIADDLRQSLSGLVDPDAGQYGYAAGVGVELTRDGKVTLDATRLREAFESDFDATAAVFTRGGDSTDADVLRYSSSARTTTPGTYDVEVTQAAKVAKLTGAITLPPPGEQQRLRIMVGGVAATVTITESETLSQAVAKVEAALDEAGVTSVDVVLHEGAGDDPSTLDLVENRPGSARALTLEEQAQEGGEWTQIASAAGEDAVVVVDGQTYVGAGRSVHITDGRGEGLRLVADGAAGTTASVTVRDGVGGALDRALAAMEGGGGSVRRAQDSMQSRIDLLQNRIDSQERRLEVRERSLQRQFTGMEVAMGRLLDQQQWLEGQLAGLMGGQGNGR